MSILAALLVLASPSSPADPPWVRMESCRSGEHVYYESSYSMERDEVLHLSAIGAALHGLADLIAPPGEEGVFTIRDLELVDAALTTKGQRALFRTTDERLLALRLPKCTVRLDPRPAKDGCPAWAYPHSTGRGEALTIVAGGVSKGDADAFAKRSRQRVVMMFLAMHRSRHHVDRTKPKSRLGLSSQARPEDDFTYERAECAGELWVRGRFTPAQKTKARSRP